MCIPSPFNWKDASLLLEQLCQKLCIHEEYSFTIALQHQTFGSPGNDETTMEKTETTFSMLFSSMQTEVYLFSWKANLEYMDACPFMPIYLDWQSYETVSTTRSSNAHSQKKQLPLQLHLKWKTSANYYIREIHPLMMQYNKKKLSRMGIL